MKSPKLKLERPTVKVKPVIQKSKWGIMVTCPNGHLLRQIRHGGIVQARKTYGKKSSWLTCGSCVNEPQY
jgi:hypothetical protein